MTAQSQGVETGRLRAGCEAATKIRATSAMAADPSVGSIAGRAPRPTGGHPDTLPLRRID